MHHHGTAAWILIVSAVFLGCASCSYGPASLFFFTPYFTQHMDTTTNTTYSLLYCGATSEQQTNNNSSSSPVAFFIPSLTYLECAFMWSNISTGLLHLVGACIVGFGGVYVFGLANHHNNNDDNENDQHTNTNSSNIESAGVGAADTTTGKLPGERYFKLFYICIIASCICGLISGILLLPTVSGRKVEVIRNSKGDVTSTHTTAARGDLLWASVFCALLGSCFIGAAMIALMSGVTIRWPNLYDVLFENAARGDHSCKARKVNRVKEKQDFLLGIEASTVRSGAVGGGGRYTSRMMSSAFDVKEEDTIDYLHMALTTPPTILFAAFISGWAASFFFANVALLSIAEETQTRSAFYAFILLCGCPAVSFLTAKMSDCCSVDQLEFGNSNNNTFGDGEDSTTGIPQQHNNEESQISLATTTNTNNSQQQQQHQRSGSGARISPRNLASLQGSNISRLGVAAAATNTEVQSVQADGLGWANNDFAPTFFRSTFRTVMYSLGEVLGEPGSRFRYDPDDDLLSRRLALRVVRSLRILGTFLTFLMLPLLLAAVIGAQVRLSAFSIMTSPPIGNHIYDRLNILTSQVPMMIVWWLLLWLLTKAVFLRSGPLKYIAVGFSLCVKGAFVLFPLQIIYNTKFNEGGPANLIPNPNGEKEVMPQLVAFLPQFFAAAATTQLNVFTIGLAFCVLPRPLFPIAISALTACWGIGELTTIRTAKLTPANSFGFPLIATFFVLNIIIVIIYFFILKWRNGFANPRVLLARFKEEAQEEAEQEQQRLQEEEQQYEENNTGDNPRYGSMEVSEKANNNTDYSSSLSVSVHARRVGGTTSVLSNRTRLNYGNYDVLPPHRLLHWSPSEIDAAFTVFDSTESSYHKRDRNANNTNEQNNNNNNYGGYGNAGHQHHYSTQNNPSSLAAHHASSGLNSSNSPMSSTPTPNNNQENQQQQQQYRPPLAPPFVGGGGNRGSPRNNESNLDPNNNNLNNNNGLPRRPKHNSTGLTPRAGGSDLKYYAVRRNSSRN